MPESFQYVSGYRISGMPAIEQLVNDMNESKLDKKFRSVASYDAGYIPYKSGWKFIDLFGLTTPEVRNNRIGTVIETNNPTIIINSVTNFNLDRSIVSNYQNGADSIPSNYALIKFIPLTNDYYWKGSNYSYFFYANENADNELIERIKNSSVSLNETIGYQKYIIDAFESMYSYITKVF